MEKINQMTKPLSVYGDRVPQIKEIAGKIGVETGVLLGGVSALTLLITLFIFGSTILTLTITVIYPSIKSIGALESKGIDDDKEWLTYWIIFGLFTLLEDFAGFILNMIPYFYWVKLVFFIFLLAPQT
jgi:receptor expression-enhancing protein 5/6